LQRGEFGLLTDCHIGLPVRLSHIEIWCGALLQINMPLPAIFSFDLPLESRAAQHFPQTYSLAGDAAVGQLGRPLLMRHPAAATRKFLPRFAIVTVIVSGWRLGVA